MTILRFEGKVESGDGYRVEGEGEGAVLIAGRDFVGEVHGTDWHGPITVAVADQRFTGDLSSDLGWGYSEYTPMDEDSLTVGAHDIIALLLAHEGKPITIWVADEPVNLLDVGEATQKAPAATGATGAGGEGGE